MLFLLAFVVAAILTLISYFQLLYLESLRLLPRDSRALDLFKENLQDRLGYDNEKGAFVFSLIKHTLLVLTGAVFVIVSAFQYLDWLALLESAVLAWGVMFVSCYILPHLLYRRSSGEWAVPLIPFLQFLALLFRPITILLDFLQSLYELSAPAGNEAKPEPGDEIDALITAGEEEGIIEKADSVLIQNVVAFGDKRVREVMTPRRNIIAIGIDRSLDDLRQLAKDQQFSRIPVYEGELDRIRGFVHVRDLYELDEAQRATRNIASILRDLKAVPESKSVAELLREMQGRNTHIVAVADEYGRVAGLVTMEDLVEEVFGEIRDEHEPEHDVIRTSDGGIIVSGAFDLDHLREYFSFRPDTSIESTTAGGLAIEWHGAVPKPAEIVEHEGIRMEILAADEFRVDKVKINLAPAPPEEPPAQ